jgi:hypothetical protein
VTSYYKPHNSYVPCPGGVTCYDPPTADSSTQPPPNWLTFTTNWTGVGGPNAPQVPAGTILRLIWSTDPLAQRCQGSDGLGDWNGGPPGQPAASTTYLTAPINSTVTYRLTCFDSTGAAGPAKAITVTVVTPPSVTTVAAINTGASSATLRATINPNDLDTTYFFNYGPSTAYTVQTPSGTIPAGSNPVDINQNITWSPPRGDGGFQGWHFRACAFNAANAPGFPTCGGDLSWPTITTYGNVTHTCLPPFCDDSSRWTFTGLINPINGPAVTSYFLKWNSVPSPLSNTTGCSVYSAPINTFSGSGTCWQPVPLGGGGDYGTWIVVDVGNAIENAKATVYYQLCAVTTAGTYCGNTNSFKTHLGSP